MSDEQPLIGACLGYLCESWTPTFQKNFLFISMIALQK